MRYARIIIGFILGAILVGCASRKATPTKLATGDWKVAQTSATVEGRWDGKHISSPVRIVAYRDSLVTVSVRPVLGIEAATIRATINGWILHVKVGNRYESGTYADVSRLIGEEVTWPKIQELASGYNPFKAIQVRYQKVDKSGSALRSKEKKNKKK